MPFSYLESSNILAARAFLAGLRPVTAKAIPVGDTGDEIWTVSDTPDRPLIFAQLAVLLCQRGRPARETWVRLYGTYQARGELVAHPEVRRVSTSPGRAMCTLLMSLLPQSIQNLSTIYFGVQPPRAAGNPFGDMLSGLFGAPPANAGAARARIGNRPGLD